MKMKHKLHAGFWLLFVVVIFFGALSLFHLRMISKSNVVIVQDNYATLEYSNQMRTVLEERDLPLEPAAIEKFKSALSKEQNNITEKGEAEAVADLIRSFGILSNPSSGIEQQQAAAREVLKYLGRIDMLNLDAIERKSQNANQTIKNATTYLGAAMAITFIVLFSFVFNLAGFFEEPLRQITEGLEQITRKNYMTRLYLDRKDEFGEVSEAFNKMAKSLDKLSAENASRLIVEKLCTDAVLKQTPDPVIGINDKSEFIFINPSAEKLFGLNRKDASEVSISKLAEDSTPIGNILTYNSGDSVKIKDSHFHIEIQEIGVSSNDLSVLSSDMGSTSDKPVGKIYIFKKQA